MDESQLLVEDGQGSLILKRLAVFLVPLFLLLTVSILSALNVVKIMSYSKSVGVIANVTISSTQGKLSGTFYDYSASFETSEKHAIYANVGKTVFVQAYAKGDSVTVYYDKNNPFVALVNHPFTIWFVPILLTSVALIWLILSVILIRTGRARR